MRKFITNLLLICTPFLLGAAAPYADASSFFAKFAEIAQDEMRLHGIPASIKLGQAALESGWGESELATYGNNYFGLKCWGEDDCTNKIYKMKDDDYDENGNLIESTFMAFENPKESFYMHTLFLKRNMKRYGKLFDLPQGDYKGWAYGLKQSGYATADNYAEKLIDIIEKYDLHKYDKQVLGNSIQLNSKRDALNALAAQAKPSNPVKEEIIQGADNTGSFGSESIANYRPNFKQEDSATTVNDFPAAPENPRASKDTWVSTSQETTTTTFDENTHDIYNQSFGSQDVKDYVPENFKELFDEKSTKGSDNNKTLNNLPNKKMIGGGSLPR